MARSRSRSLRSLLAEVSGNREDNSSEIIAPDAESEESVLSVPDPKEVAQDLKSVVDALGGEGKTDELLDKLGDTGNVIKGLFKI